MKKILTNKEYERMTEEIDKVKYICSCGHRVVIPKYINKVICNWCGNYVFKNKKDKDLYRIKEKIVRSEKNDV